MKLKLLFLCSLSIALQEKKSRKNREEKVQESQNLLLPVSIVGGLALVGGVVALCLMCGPGNASQTSGQRGPVSGNVKAASGEESDANSKPPEVNGNGVLEDPIAGGFGSNAAKGVNQPLTSGALPNGSSQKNEKGGLGAPPSPTRGGYVPASGDVVSPKGEPVGAEREVTPGGQPSAGPDRGGNHNPAASGGGVQAPVQPSTSQPPVPPSIPQQPIVRPSIPPAAPITPKTIDHLFKSHEVLKLASESQRVKIRNDLNQFTGTELEKKVEEYILAPHVMSIEEISAMLDRCQNSITFTEAFPEDAAYLQAKFKEQLEAYRSFGSFVLGQSAYIDPQADNPINYCAAQLLIHPKTDGGFDIQAPKNWENVELDEYTKVLRYSTVGSHLGKKYVSNFYYCHIEQLAREFEKTKSSDYKPILALYKAWFVFLDENRKNPEYNDVNGLNAALDGLRDLDSLKPPKLQKDLGNSVKQWIKLHSKSEGLVMNMCKYMLCSEVIKKTQNKQNQPCLKFHETVNSITKTAQSSAKEIYGDSIPECDSAAFEKQCKNYVKVEILKEFARHYVYNNEILAKLSFDNLSVDEQNKDYKQDRSNISNQAKEYVQQKYHNSTENLIFEDLKTALDEFIKLKICLSDIHINYTKIEDIKNEKDFDSLIDSTDVAYVQAKFKTQIAWVEKTDINKNFAFLHSLDENNAFDYALLQQFISVDTNFNPILKEPKNWGKIIIGADDSLKLAENPSEDDRKFSMQRCREEFRAFKTHNPSISYEILSSLYKSWFLVLSDESGKCCIKELNETMRAFSNAIKVETAPSVQVSTQEGHADDLSKNFTSDPITKDSELFETIGQEQQKRDKRYYY